MTKNKGQGTNNDMLWMNGQVLLVGSWEAWGLSAAAHAALPVFTAADWNQMPVASQQNDYQGYWMLLTGGDLMEWLKGVAPLSDVNVFIYLTWNMWEVIVLNYIFPYWK